MATKNLSRTVIEGGRTRGNKWDRRLGKQLRASVGCAVCVLQPLTTETRHAAAARSVMGGARAASSPASGPPE